MNSKDTKSSEQLRKDVLVQLDKVDSDIDQMGMRLTPGQFIDDIIYYPRGGNPAATFDLLKDNPVGTTFLTLGTLMLMENEHHMTYEQVARSRVSGVVSEGKIRAQSAVNQGRDNVNGIISKGRETVESVKGSVDRVKSRFHRNQYDNSPGMLDKARAKVDAAIDSSKEMLSDAQDQIEDVVDSSQSKFQDLKQDVQEKFSGGNEDREEIGFDGYTNDYSQNEDINRERAIEDARIAFSKEEETSGFSGISSMNGESGIGSVKSKIPDTEEVKARVQGAISSASSKASELKQDLRENLSGVGDNISDKAQQGMSAVKSMDPMTYVAVGAGLGALTGLALPVPDSEQNFIDSKLDGTISSFTEDLQSALNESAGILKDLVISDMKSMSLDVFKR